MLRLYRWQDMGDTMNLISYGATYHAKRLMKMLPETFTSLNEPAIDNKENYILGLWDLEFNELQNGINEGKKMHLHFIGSDAVGLLMSRHRDREYIKENMDNINIASQSFLTHNILSQAGIESKIVTFGPPTIPKITPFPKKPTYAFYFGRENGPYDMKAFLYYALHYPEMKFKIFGNNDDIQDVPKNTDVLGWLDEEGMEDLRNNCTGLLRLSAWDGFPLSIMEFAMAGRHIVSNMPFPGRNIDILEFHSGNPNKELSRYYIKKYGPEQTCKTIKEFIK